MSATRNAKRTPKRQQADPEETDVKRRKESEAFRSYFTKVEKPPPQKTLCAMENPRFQPYVIKEGWTMAPFFSRQLTEQERTAFDASLLKLADSDALKNGLRRIKRGKITRVSNVSQLKAKLFQFHDNYRPPYYGTWRYYPKTINGRKPFARAVKNLRKANYDYDSDAEWEQEPSDAEECKSDDEEDAKDDSDIEDDDGFFVEHGYLSADEGTEENEKNSAKYENETEEQRKKRLARTAQEWEENRKQKERRFKEKRVDPNMYLTEFDKDPSEHNAQRRYVMIGVLFDYSKLVPKPVTVRELQNK